MLVKNVKVLDIVISHNLHRYVRRKYLFQNSMLGTSELTSQFMSGPSQSVRCATGFPAKAEFPDWVSATAPSRCLSRFTSTTTSISARSQ